MANEQRVALVLFLATLAVYWPARTYDFTNYDDPAYVKYAPHVQGGLTLANVRWALVSIELSNWHPLTWLSLQLDRQLFSGSAYGYHLTNIVLHAFNTTLLFWVLWRMTGRRWPSALVAGLFGLHPLHVESVAWIVERKDVLSGFFWMLTLLFYKHYVERPGFGRYLAVFIALGLGLMAKPMLVTLPFVLLLLDYWPLNRLQTGSFNRDPAGSADVTAPGDSDLPRHVVRAPRWVAVKRAGGQSVVCHLPSAILEKLPLLVLCLAACGVTLYAQALGQSIQPLDKLPVGERLANALVAYSSYLAKAVWPRHLAVFYPRRHLAWSDPRVLIAGLVVVALSAVALAQVRRRPYLFVGWFWYLGTLVPVIGLVQVGNQAMADRYTYLPLIGIFLMASWGLADLARGDEAVRTAVAGVASAVLVALVLCTGVQLQYWHDSVTLWTHALEATGPNAPALVGLGTALSDRGEAAAALRQFTEAAAIAPADVRVHFNRGLTLLTLARPAEAAEEFRIVQALNPNHAQAHYGLGAALSGQGKLDQGMAEYREALRLDPHLARAHLSLAVCLIKQKKFSDARTHVFQALEQDPADARVGLGFLARVSPDAGKQQAELLDLVAAAQAVGGNLGEAAQTARKAVEAARSAGRSDLIATLQERARDYEERSQQR
jgi:tetratricopeptide (TPR) repeat protein